MKTLTLKDFFDKVKYDWEKDKERINTIAYYTKTRVEKNKTKNYLHSGVEQTFLIQAIAEWINAESFFEIGTGRGTACYALASVPSVKEIHTVDILDFNQKFSTAIGYKPANVSLKDIRAMIPFKEKSKVHFHHRKEFASLRKNFKNKFDLAFIDGDHTSKGVILEDYAVCQELLKDGGIILWDDYDPDQFAVKGIVDEIVKNNPNLDTILVEQRGHLFPDKEPEIGKGVVLMKQGKLFDNE